MPTRLIFVGNTSEGKLFYNVDANPTEKNAMFVDSTDTETPVDLVSFISSNPDINESIIVTVITSTNRTKNFRIHPHDCAIG